MKQTGFFWDEKCFWHAGGNFALTMPLGGNVQPLASGGLPENPETKRRLKNLMDVTGLMDELACKSAEPATTEDLARIHPAAYLAQFKEMSDAGGGELGLRTPFAQGGYEIAALSAGLTKAALLAVLRGDLKNAYALSRPPGHHCLPDYPNGFCLLANVAIAIEAARALGLGKRFAVLDWDVHHGNGTEAIFYERDDVLSISMHQDHNYPLDSGDISDKGRNSGDGHNINIPLPPGCGDATYLAAMDLVALPAIRAFAPDVIIIACGFDASPFDPLAHMLVTADGFRQMTSRVMDLANEICEDKLVMAHEGGYSEAYVPFCGHAVIAEMAGSSIDAGDPLLAAVNARQPNARMQAFHREILDEFVMHFGLGSD
ncbi:MAG: acetoin utilization deacetylase AcuC-like enzyme [Paracoccaceae bacterium]|jgi:acetoin utilization deacetylase AcuC-like enzyme